MVDGPISIDKFRVNLTDLLVHVPYEMLKHKNLVTNWDTILRATGDDNSANASAFGKTSNRADIAKQRVLVQMLVCGTELEVIEVVEEGFLSTDVDPESVRQDFKRLTKSKKKGAGKPGLSHEH